MVRAMQTEHCGPRYAKDTKWSKVCKGDIVVQNMQRVPSDPRYAKGI